MPAKERIRFNIDVTTLPLSPLPRVVEVVVEDYVDTSGEDSLRAWIVLADDTPDEALTGEAYIEMTDAIRDWLREHGYDLFTYWRFVGESERPWLAWRKGCQERVRNMSGTCQERMA